MIVCRVCGFSNEEGAQFCGNCGTFLEWSGEPTEASTPPSPTTPTPPSTPTPTAPTPVSTPTPTATSPTPTPPPAPRETPAAGVTDTITCRVCGTDNEAGRSFCRRCASPLEAAVTAPAPFVEPATSTGGRAAGPRVPLIAAGAVVLVVSVLVVGAIGLGVIGGGPGATPSPSLAAEATPTPLASDGPTLAPTPTLSLVPTGRLAFSVHPEGGSWDIATSAPDGSDRRVVVSGPGDDLTPAWAPDGRRIVYASDAGLVIVDADGGNPAPLTDDAGHHDPDWSPDGSAVVFSSSRDGDFEIYVVRLDAPGQIVQLTSNDAHDYDPVWMPDGTRILFGSNRAGTPDLWTMLADGTDPVQLTSEAAVADDPAISPDGSWITFTTDRDGPYRLMIMRSDGTEVRELTLGLEPEHDGAFSPDSQFVVIQRGDVRRQLAVLGVDGREYHLFGDPTEFLSFPSWTG